MNVDLPIPIEIIYGWCTITLSSFDNYIPEQILMYNGSILEGTIIGNTVTLKNINSDYNIYCYWQETN
jgi:hypothetical protein